MKQFWQAVAILIGTIVGAGILGIPYVVSQSGYLLGLIELIIIGLLMMATNLYLAEVSQRTEGRHHLAGLAGKYLGNTGKSLMLFATMFGIYGALLAYLIGQSQVLSTIFGGNPVIYGIVYFILLAAIIFIGLKAVERADLFIISANILLIIVISIISLFKTSAANLVTFNFRNIFLPYGVMLFAFMGTNAIPEVRYALEKQPRLLKRAIIFGSVIPIIIYLLFTTAVVGTVGGSFSSLPQYERVATIALGKIFPQLALLANLFAFFAMTTAFLSLGLALKDTYTIDYKIKKNFAWALTVLIPFGIWLINTFVNQLTTFISILGIVGSITGGLTGILIVLMNWKAKEIGKRKPEFEIDRSKKLGYLLIAIFILGIAYEILRRIIFF